MRLAKAWGATNYDWIAVNAAEGGHKAIVHLAVSWGATNHWIAATADGGHEALVRQIEEW